MVVQVLHPPFKRPGGPQINIIDNDNISGVPGISQGGKLGHLLVYPTTSL